MRVLTLFGCLMAGAVTAPASGHAEPPIWLLARSLRAAALRPAATPALAPTMPAGAASPGDQCRAAIAAAEPANGIPSHLLAAIGRVESGRRDPSGTVTPWPWTLNVEGVDHVYENKADAIAAVRRFQASGARSIDVGCLQVNLMFHPEAFASLDDAFDPQRNAQYAAQFLSQLHQQTGNWTTATAWYHSASPDLGGDYARKVMAALPQEQAGWPANEGVPPAHALAAPQPGGTGRFMLSNNAPARLIPAAAGTIGRSLAEYRAAPIRIARTIALR
jgi:hypothetical protein